MFHPWYNVVMLDFESSSVINRRDAKIGLGGVDAITEMQFMVAEKWDAARTASLALMLGGTLNDTVDRYRLLVAANEARLSAQPA